MVTRWSIAMQELDFKIHFVPGSQNKWADTLSRLCPNLMELAMDYTPRVMDAPSFIVAALTTSPLASEEESEWMEQAHNFRVGHGGVDRTMHKLGLMGRFWPYMRNHVRLFVRYCPCCQKMSAVRIPINVHKLTTAGEILFDVLNIDFIGPFPRRHTRACHRGLIFKMDRAVPLQGQYGGVSMPLSSRTLRSFRFTQPYTFRSRTTLR